MPALNLLPWREQSRHVGIRRLQGLLLGVGLLAVLIVWVADQLGRQVQQRQMRERTSIHQAIERLDAQLAQVAQLKVEQEQVEHRLQALGHLQGKQLFLLELFESLERAVPQGVYLTAVTREGMHLHIHGLARSGSLVAQLLRNLSSALGEAEMQQMKAVDEGEAFELSVTMGDES
ncbi:PilN domain-containing protein [Pseudomonas sp. GZD-222]|uniref:PilN domain-containing protein n=1 Tax=Pseudomonas sp. GZD-222 TaxID=3404805 RepID=UPI003BB595AA